MGNFFNKCKSDSKDEEDESKLSEDIPHQNNAGNTSDGTGTEENKKDKDLKTTADEIPSTDSNLPDAPHCFAKLAESELSEDNNAETTFHDDQEKPETNSSVEGSKEEVQTVTASSQTPIRVRSVATDVDDLATDNQPSADEELEYTFDEAIELIGYGKFQKLLTMLIGISWFADSFQVLTLVIVSGTIACRWTIYMWQNALLTTNLFVGMMLGSPFFGVVADVLGRRRAMSISMLSVFIFSALCSIPTHVIWLLAFRFFVGFSLGSLSQGVTLCVEYHPLEFRAMAGFYIVYYWAFGNIFLVVTCWVILESTTMWRFLMFVVSLPALGAFISTSWYPESVRFYLVTDQYRKAVQQLKQVASVNNAKLPPGHLKDITVGEQERTGSIVDLLKSPHTRNTLLFWYIWFAVAFHYYGIILVTPMIIKHGTVMIQPEEASHTLGVNATSTPEFFLTELPCKIWTTKNYFDLLWTGTAEIPGMFVYSLLVQYAQRKKLLSISILVNSVLVLFLLVDFISPIPGKLVFFVARANSGGIFQLIMVMTSEVFPTTLRATSMGSSHAFSMLGAATVPYAAQVLVINQPIVAMSVLSGIVLLAAVAAILLPREMKGEQMKDFSKDYREMEKAAP